MAWLEPRGNSWRVVFRHLGRRYSFTVGEIPREDAAAFLTSTEELLRLLRRNVVAVPPGCSIEDFMFFRGKPPERSDQVFREAAQDLTLSGMREAYFRAQQQRLEATTLAGIRLHFDHLTRLLGANTAVSLLTRADLQGYLDRRSAEWIDPERYRRKRQERAADAPPRRKYTRKTAQTVPDERPERPRRHPSPATLKKEIVSFRTAWNWARRHLTLTGEFPGSGLDYAKTEEGLPFMTWDEAERRVTAGDDPERVWDSIYLRPPEVAELLAWVKERPVSPWVYPMFCFAAHTGARRSEVVRSVPADLDLAAGVVTVREKKRDRTRYTTRRVPLTPFLRSVMADWLTNRAAGKTLFCRAKGEPVSPREAHNYFHRALRVSRWSVLKGWHVFRHSFISALASKGVDQRVIDDLVGHSTDEQRRRYRHLYPDVKQKAVADVFG